MNVLGRVGHAKLASSYLWTEPGEGESLIRNGLHAPLNEFTGLILHKVLAIVGFLFGVGFSFYRIAAEKFQICCSNFVAGLCYYLPQKMHKLINLVQYNPALPN